MIDQTLTGGATAGMLLLSTFNGVVLASTMSHTPDTLVDWVLGPVGALALSLYVAFQLWKYVKKRTEKIEDLRDKIEEMQKEEIEELKKRLDE